MKRWLESLQQGQTIKRTVHGNSMTPRIHSGDTVTIVPVTDPSSIDIGDVVFCKVNGSFYVHLVTKRKYDKKKNRWSFLISNNHGRDNGWTSQIYGKIL